MVEWNTTPITINRKVVPDIKIKNWIVTVDYDNMNDKLATSNFVRESNF